MDRLFISLVIDFIEDMIRDNYNLQYTDEYRKCYEYLNEIKRTFNTGENVLSEDVNECLLDLANRHRFESGDYNFYIVTICDLELELIKTILDMTDENINHLENTVKLFVKDYPLNVE